MKKGLLAFVAVLVFAAVVNAQPLDSVEVSLSRDVHQQWQLIEVNDIHFVTYPREPWVGIVNWEMRIKGSPPYTYTVDSVYNDEGKLHWLRFDVTFVTPVPYCTWITIDVTLWLDQQNSIFIDSVYWTSNGVRIGGDTKFDAPGQGFSVDNISASGMSTLWIQNPSDEVLLFRDVRLARNQPTSASASDLNTFSDWTDAVKDFTVAPSESYAVPLEDMAAGAFLYMTWDIYTPGDGVGADVLVGTANGVHEDQLGALPMNIEESGMLKDVKFLDVSANPGYSEIHYYLPKATHAKISVYTVSGELVTTLVDEEQCAGGHTLRWEGEGQPAGLYIARLSADGVSAAEKMIRVK